MKRLVLVASAQQDLSRIAQYTEREWGVRQKTRYLGEIEACLQALRRNPSLGAPRNDLLPGCRSIVVVSHVIFYRDAGEAIETLRVLHHGMDVHRRLPPEGEVEGE